MNVVYERWDNYHLKLCNPRSHNGVALSRLYQRGDFSLRQSLRPVLYLGHRSNSISLLNRKFRDSRN